MEWDDDLRNWGQRKPPPSGPVPDPEATRLYNIYSGWTAQLHTWVATQLDRHIDCEFFPKDWEFRLYSGEAGASISSTGIPSVMRPADERTEIVMLPTPEDLPNDEDLDYTFRMLCVAAARILRLKASKRALDNPKSLPDPLNALEDEHDADTDLPF